MTSITPMDAGQMAAQTIPVRQEVPAEFFLPVTGVEQMLQTSADAYERQQNEALLNSENSRYAQRLATQRQNEYVQAQQNMQQMRPNFVDPDLIRQQIQWLISSL